MGDKSKIEWTDATWNPIRARNRETGKLGWFCTHASDGCRNCYAESINRRLGTGVDFKAQNRERVDIFVDEKLLTQPLRWNKPRKIFVGSMTDLFGEFVTDEMIDQVFAVMALAPQHIFQVLTKRPDRMRKYFAPNDHRRADSLGAKVIALGYKAPLELLRWPLPNVWLGTSAEDQPAADTRIPELLETPAAARFVSFEPLLGPVNPDGWLSEKTSCGECDDGEGWGQNQCSRRDIPRDEQCPLNWAVYSFSEGPLDKNGVPKWIKQVQVCLDFVIVGGESGPRARPMHPDWVRQIRDHCARAGVPFFFKQWGEWGPDEVEGGRLLRFLRPSGDQGAFFERGCAVMERRGKKAAGAMLDGVEYRAFPRQLHIREAA